MKKKFLLTLTLIVSFSISFAQLGKLKQMAQPNKNKQEDSADTAKVKKGFGAGLMNKAMGTLAKAAGSIGGKMMGMVATTADLNSVQAQVINMSNLYSKDVNVLTQTMFEGWETGGNMVMLSFTAKNSIQVNKIDGEVLVNSKPANYTTSGIYTSFTNDNSSEKTIEIKTSSGQKASFTLKPPTHTIKLLSINGLPSGANVDLTKEVTLELDLGATADPTPVSVWLTGQTLGMRTFYEVGWFAPKSKITIPAAMFRNMNVGTNPVSFPNTFIQVSRSKLEKATNTTGVIPELIYANYVSDVKPINVSGKPNFNRGLNIKEEFNAKSGNKVKIEATKKNAMMSPPLSNINKIGVMSFLFQGTTTVYEAGENKLQGIKYEKEAKFTTFPEPVYQNIMNKMYAQIVAILKEETKSEIVPIEKITSSKTYVNTVPYMGLPQESKPDYTFTFKNTKAQVGLKPLGQSMGYNSAEHKVMAETGANALLKVTINLDINFDGPNALMIPKLIYEIPGETLGETYSTNYMSGTISATPFKIPKSGYADPQKLEIEVLKAEDLIDGFRKAIQLVKAGENANPDYEIVWQTMNK